MRDVLTAGRYFREKYGVSVYKIPISLLGFTCPNIDGTVAKGGCVFCENESFSPNIGGAKQTKKFYLSPRSTSNPYLDFQLLQIETQYQKSKTILQKKFGAQKFMIYFQSFTNTYAPLETLKVLYEKALSLNDVVGLSIGTRTDSIDHEVLSYLQKLSAKSEIWVEYGIQSVFNETLTRVNRGHNVQSMEEIIKLTCKHDINVCAHLIFGLPGETQDMMLKSVKFAVDMGVKSIKIHPLYVVKRTALASDVIKGLFTPISQEFYIETLVKALKMIPEEIMIQRVSAGIGNETLISPSWCFSKHQQMQYMRKILKKEGLYY